MSDAAAATEAPRSGSAAWRHCTADVSGVASSVLDDVPGIVAVLERALDAPSSGTTEVRSHRFEPSGVSLVVASARLRVVAHTWPELGTLTLDVHSASIDPSVVIQRCLGALVAAGTALGASPEPPLALR